MPSLPLHAEVEASIFQMPAPPAGTHVICDLPPKLVAAAMGHSVQTHLAAYSRWCGDDVVDDAFAKAEQRLGQGLRAQSAAA